MSQDSQLKASDLELKKMRIGRASRIYKAFLA
jgi:hypothetical protein